VAVAPFIYEASACRVIFARGGISRASEEINTLGKRALILTSPEQREIGEALLGRLGTSGAGLFSGAAMHVPLEVVEAAQLQLDLSAVDCLIALGGGSTIGLAKILMLRNGLPTLAIPTSFAGSEMTPIWGLTEAGRKTTGRDARVRPRTVIYDPDLVMTLPASLAAASGMNAIAHACEALYAADANPVTSLMARESIRVLSGALPRIVQNPSNPEAWVDALYGAWFGGTVLGAVAMALHHKLCHTLGGRFNLPHAELHTALLPHAIAYNASAAPEAMLAVERALDVRDAATGLFDLATRLGAPTSLSQLGMPGDGIEGAVKMAIAAPYPNPRPLEANALHKLLSDAWAGRRPAERNA
jgi:maleylacetate reductase